MTNGTGITGLTEREEEIVGLLSRAYESLMLDAKVMDLHKQNGRYG